jgi:hypothetical protein
MINREAAALAFTILQNGRVLIELMAHYLESVYLDVHGEAEAYNAEPFYKKDRLNNIRQSLKSVQALLEELDKLEADTPSGNEAA